MKIVDGQVMARIDRTSIEERGIPSLCLMERAGWSVANEVRRLYPSPDTPVTVLCGKGNNGGDGFVIARHLSGYGYRPKALLSCAPDLLSRDSRINWERYAEAPFASWAVYSPKESTRYFDGNPAVVDALLGTGSKGAPAQPISSMIELANSRSRGIIGVDIPSGVDSGDGQIEGQACHCASTVTFGLPKRGHFLRGGLSAAGKLTIAGIGFPDDLLRDADSNVELITAGWVRKNMPSYPLDAHKGSRGRTLLTAGSAEMLGAALLCARACLAMGAGLLTLALPESLNLAAKVAVPECMTLPLPETRDGFISETALAKLLDHAGKADALGIGPGLGQHPETRRVVIELMRKFEGPVVADADALNALAMTDYVSLLRARRWPTALTPHPGEMSRLMAPSTVAEIEADRWAVARQFAERTGACLLLKGAATVVAAPGCPLRVNRTGHPAMAQGGMGDALTGFILSLLGQGKGALESAAMAAFLHGKAAESAVEDGHRLAVSAGAVIAHLGKAAQETGVL